MDSQSGAVSRPRFFWAAPVLTAIVASLTFIPVPRQPFLLDPDLSERAVLNYANQHSWRFGTEVVFTYGPWTYLTSRYYFPHQYEVQMVVLTLFSFLIAAGVCLVAWRMPLFCRALLLSLFIYFSANLDPRADFLIYTGLLSWGWLSLVEKGKAFVMSGLCYALIAVFGFMTKANFLVVAGCGATVIACDLLLKRRFCAALLFLPGLMFLFLASWLFSAQTLAQLPAFFANSFSMIRDYDEIMGLDSPATYKNRALAVVFLALSSLLIRAMAAERSADGVSVRVCQWRTIMITVWLSFLMFVMWKHGFVRADTYHMGLVFGVIPLLAVSIELLPSPRSMARFLSRALALGSCTVAVIALQALFFSSFGRTLLQPFAGFQENLSALLHPSDYENKLRQPYERARGAAQLPELRRIIGNATVDVFGQCQCYAIFNDLKYHNRPVFQSYVAFNERLMGLNEQFYLSSEAPKYVLFDLTPGDHKFPPLEDARVLRHLLLNYDKIAAEGPFLLLESKTALAVRMNLIQEGTARLNEKISLPENTTDFVWMEIDLEPNWQSQIRQAFYKLPKARLAFWPLEGKRLLSKSAAPCPMLAAGFIVSPLLMKTDDVRDLFEGKGLVRPAACSIEVSPDALRFWKPTCNFRIYTFEKVKSASLKASVRPGDQLLSQGPMKGVVDY